MFSAGPVTKAAFVPKELEELIKGAKEARSVYKRKVKAKNQVENPERLNLITFLELVHEFVQKINPSEEITEKDKQAICLGAWIYCLENIGNEYWVFSPESSALYEYMLEILNISNFSILDKTHKTIYLNKLHYFLTHDELDLFYILENSQRDKPINLRDDAYDSLGDAFSKHDLNINLIEANLTSMLKNAFSDVKPMLNCLLNAIPVEKMIDERMQKLYVDYLSQTKYNNDDRKFLAKLAVAICDLNRASDDLNVGISESQLIKMGVLIFIMESIAKTYTIQSSLYQLCCDILNIKCHQDIDPVTRRVCLCKFESYINDYQHKARLGSYLNTHFANCQSSCIYIDDILRPYIKSLDVLLDHMYPATGWHISKFAIFTAGIGAMIGAAPGYGAGYALGNVIALTDPSEKIKIGLGETSRFVMTVILGNSGKYLGYYSSNTFINATTERAFAKILEKLNSIICWAGGGLVGIIIYDWTYQTFYNLFKLCLHLHPQAEVIKNMDPELIQLFLTAPNELVSNKEKENIKLLMGNAEPLPKLKFFSRTNSSDNLVLTENKENALSISFKSI